MTLPFSERLYSGDRRTLYRRHPLRRGIGENLVPTITRSPGISKALLIIPNSP